MYGMILRTSPAGCSWENSDFETIVINFVFSRFNCIERFSGSIWFAVWLKFFLGRVQPKIKIYMIWGTHPGRVGSWMKWIQQHALTILYEKQFNVPACVAFWPCIIIFPKSSNRFFNGAGGNPFRTPISFMLFFYAQFSNWFSSPTFFWIFYYLVQHSF